MSIWCLARRGRAASEATAPARLYDGRASSARDPAVDGRRGPRPGGTDPPRIRRAAPDPPKLFAGDLMPP